MKSPVPPGSTILSVQLTSCPRKGEGPREQMWTLSFPPPSPHPNHLGCADGPRRTSHAHFLFLISRPPAMIALLSWSLASACYCKTGRGDILQKLWLGTKGGEENRHSIQHLGVGRGTEGQCKGWDLVGGCVCWEVNPNRLGEVWEGKGCRQSHVCVMNGPGRILPG